MEPYTGIMQETRVEERNGGYYVAGSRVSLDSVVYAYLRGESLTGIVESFPALNLEQVSAAVEFFLANRPLVENYLRNQTQKEDQMYEAARSQDPVFYQMLEDARKRTPSLIA
jgi:uncharacterized protein (DUF433 family)